MAIVINGSGTVTGLSVGGLPDGTVDAGTLATNSVDSAELVDGAVDDSHIAALAASKLTGALPAISGANLINTTAGQLTGSLPAIDGSALTNLVQQDPTVLPYVNLDVSGHTNVGNFTIDSRGRYRIFLDLRVGYSNNAGFTKVYLGTSSGGGQVGNARLIIENVGNSSNGTANIGLNFQWVMDFGTSLSYPYTVYANVYNSGTGSSSIFNQSDTNGYPVVSCLKVKDITTSTGMVGFGS
jgi:hypothetical protein